MQTVVALSCQGAAAGGGKSGSCEEVEGKRCYEGEGKREAGGRKNGEEVKGSGGTNRREREAGKRSGKEIEGKRFKRGKERGGGEGKER